MILLLRRDRLHRRLRIKGYPLSPSFLRENGRLNSSGKLHMSNPQTVNIIIIVLYRNNTVSKEDIDRAMKTRG
jgi:hypothetical protein